MRQTTKFLWLGLAVCGVLATGATQDPAQVEVRSDGPQLEGVATGDQGGEAQLDPEAERVKRGYQIAPVPLDLRHRDRVMVGLGSYIVNAQGGCNDCHTNPPFAPGHDPFLGQPKQINADGYLAGGVEFGPIVSKNITPDDEGLPAGLTQAEFKKLLRVGHEPGEGILQVMPWPVYGQMTDRDLRAVYTYLTAIPHKD